MAKITKFNVVKMACFLGLFGVFMGLVFGIILAILTFFVPVVGAYKLWMILVGVPVGYGVMMFISALIFTPLMNLTLKIIKGLDLDLDLTESVPVKKVVSTNPIQKQEIKPVPKHPIKSFKDSKPISQMTNSKTTAQNSINPAV